MSSSEFAQTELVMPVVEHGSFLTNDSEWVINPVVDFLLVGGPVVWILMLFSVIALTIVILKCFQFLMAKAEQTAEINDSLRAWQNGQIGKASEALTLQMPISRVVLAAQQACCDVYSHHDVSQDQRQVLLQLFKATRNDRFVEPLVRFVGNGVGHD